MKTTRLPELVKEATDLGKLHMYVSSRTSKSSVEKPLLLFCAFGCSYMTLPGERIEEGGFGSPPRKRPRLATPNDDDAADDTSAMNDTPVNGTGVASSGRVTPNATTSEASNGKTLSRCNQDIVRLIGQHLRDMGFT